jgi:transposase
MAVLRKTLVDIPQGSGVHVKSAGAKAEKYVYKYTKYFRNAEGKPRNKSVSIGKFDPESRKMIPNNNYFRLYDTPVVNTQPEIAGMSVFDYGFSYLVLKCARETGLLECLSDAFGDRAMDILVASAYIIREGNSMDGIDDWLERTFFEGYSNILNSQKISRLFESFSTTQTHNFFQKWGKIARTNGNVCYDVTSISSYSSTMTDVEYGYNRDGDDLPQFNLGLFCNEDNKLPLYFNRYSGSLTDKSNLKYVFANAKSVGIKNVKLIVDGGFIGEECIKSLNSCGVAFTVGIPANLKMSQKMIDNHLINIEKFTHKLQNYEIYCVENQIEYHGVKGRLMLFYDPMNHAQLCNEMSERIRSLNTELSALKRYPKNNLKRYSKYFIIDKHENDDGFDYRLNTEYIDRLRQHRGFFLIFTTDGRATHDDILCHYRAKDAAEKMFDQIKNDMRGRRFYTHNEKTTDGKMFVIFVALVIRTYLLEKLKDYLREHSTSLRKVLNQLTNITIFVHENNARLTRALTKKQKDILNACDASNAEKHFLQSIQSCLR